MWDLVEYTFRRHLQLDLEAVRHTRSWRWFTVMLDGLLADDTPLRRWFRKDEPERPEQPAPV